MNSFELEIDEKSQAGSQFMAQVINEIRRAVATEKATRKITQQAIADKIGTSRAVINRQIQGLENLSARRIGEILWAIGWEPHFEARRIPAEANQRPSAEMIPFRPMPPTITSGGVVIDVPMAVIRKVKVG